MRSRSRMLVAGAAGVAVLLGVGGIAWALQSPIDNNGAIHACNPSGSSWHVRIYDPSIFPAGGEAYAVCILAA